MSVITKIKNLKLFFLFLMFILSLKALSQQGLPVTVKPAVNAFNKDFIGKDSGTIIRFYRSTACKKFMVVSRYKASETMPIIVKNKISPASIPKVKFLTVHGNITYDFFYRSRIDTPFFQKDLQQHTEKIYLNLLLMERYPLKANFILRQSSSPYSKNYADLNLQFDPYQYRKNLKEELLNKLVTSLGKIPELKALQTLLAAKAQQLLNLKGWLSNPATLQKIIEERERQYGKQFTVNQPAGVEPPNNPTAAAGEHFHNNFFFNKPIAVNQTKDSTVASFSHLFDNRQAEMDSLQKNIKYLHQQEDSFRRSAQKNIAAVRQKIAAADSEKDLMKIASANGLPIKERDQLQKKLASIRSFSIGRSRINYTELTARDIIVTGLNVEYNPSYYLAFAAGKIDYRFRDFYNKNSTNGQYLVMGRLGMGNPDKQAIIMTVFKGQKNPSAYVLNDSIANHQVGIIGYSLEGILKKNEHTGISVEVAKSTKPVAGYQPTNKQLQALWTFADQSNLGINIKAQTLLPYTKTKLSGFYRKTGQNFQSFSLFSYNTDQTSWLLKAEQSFFKKRLGLTGMLRRNDFANPFTEKTYKSSTIFKSMILNLRVPKYPSISIGYFPGTQLYVVDKETLRESAYYLVNGSMNYSYFYKGINMNTSLVYNRYFNQATDSGFLSYKGISYYAMQTIFLKKFQLQTGYAYNFQPGLKYTTIEGAADYSLNRILKIGLGTKYNKVTAGNHYWGQRIQLLTEIGRLGRLQFQYEKSYLPTIGHSLYAVEIGRVSWYKYF